MCNAKRPLVGLGASSYLYDSRVLDLYLGHRSFCSNTPACYGPNLFYGRYSPGLYFGHTAFLEGVNIHG